MISYPVPEGTLVVLRHDSHEICPMHGDAYLVYVTWTGEHWALIRLNLWLCASEAAEFRSFVEAKRAYDSGAVKWEKRK